MFEYLYLLKRLEDVLLFANCFDFTHSYYSTISLEDFSDES